MPCLGPEQDENDASAANTHQQRGAGPVSSIFDMHLPVACLALLHQLVLRSIKALAHMTASPARWAAGWSCAWQWLLLSGRYRTVTPWVCCGHAQLQPRCASCAGPRATLLR
jgi:hypothetical protein